MDQEHGGWQLYFSIITAPRRAFEQLEYEERSWWPSWLLGALGSYPSGLLLGSLALPKPTPVRYLLGIPAALLCWLLLLGATHGLSRLWGGRGRLYDLGRLWGYTSLPGILLRLFLTVILASRLFPGKGGEPAVFLPLMAGLAVGGGIWMVVLSWHGLQVAYGFRQRTWLVLISLWVLFFIGGQLINLAAPSVFLKSEALAAMQKGTAPTAPLPRGENWGINLRVRAAFLPGSGWQRGDLAVWQSDDQFRIGRVIALPGDLVAAQNGRVTVNRQPATPSVPGSGNWSLPQQRVPDGAIFILGDNRSLSPSSYGGGMVPRRTLTGRPLSGEIYPGKWWAMPLNY